MELTGKCKVEFEKYWEGITTPAISGELHHFGVVTNFKVGIKDLTDSMKYGVLVDFFDSVGIEVNIYCGIWDNNFYVCVQKIQEEINYTKRPEARTKAIEKANEIFNKQ